MPGIGSVGKAAVIEMDPTKIFLFLHTLHPLVYIGFLLLFGYVGGEIANYLKTPRVTGYLVMGMLLSPSVLGLFYERLVKEELALITHIALGIIAFSIGGSLSIANLKKLGKYIIWINVTEAVGAFLLVTIILAIFFLWLYDMGPTSSPFWGIYFPLALVIGATCAATAPAGVLAIVHEYRAKGPFTAILLGVVALDDGMAILLYAFSINLAESLMTHHLIAWHNILFSSLSSIVLSLCIGGLLGVGLRKLVRFVPRREAMLAVSIGLIFLTSGLGISLGVSPLLANMMLGFVIINFVEHHEDIFTVVESLEEPIFCLFFTLAGAHLNLRALETAGWLALIITLGRFVGKLLGAHLGAQISQAPEAVKKYLGFGLMPAAGVTVGLVLNAKEVLGVTPLTEVMVNAVLGAVILNQLISPPWVRFSLFKAGEAGDPKASISPKPS